MDFKPPRWYHHIDGFHTTKVVPLSSILLLRHLARSTRSLRVSAISSHFLSLSCLLTLGQILAFQILAFRQKLYVLCSLHWSWYLPVQICRYCMASALSLMGTVDIDF